MPQPDFDFTFQNHGLIWLCQPENEEAREHLHANVGEETQFWGNAVVVEPRYVEGLAANLAANGFTTN